ncbi:hypothetical protein [Halobaculum magnesiiphilum]|uniref:Uncharacterized protein n=1 Tax=Halobaculum magnesiiphilum TaxID=1017351 RepID=A0A8T8W930_9EURY|nr:hypothetical protein [Halobaculum magnesiiphilum]QZP36338.1 hypothetical protein K6T50_08300 [Halobaculum magnesiiphilum]
MGLSNLLRKAVGDYRHNKAAAFAHGVRVLTTFITGAVTGLAVLAYLGVIRPFQLLLGAGYAAIIVVADYALVSDLAMGLRFVAPDLLGFLSLSTLVSLVTAVGALSIAWRWDRAR